MPVYEVELSDGRVFEVESDTPPTEADVLAALPTLGTDVPDMGTPAERPGAVSSGGASAAIAAAKGVPGAIRTAGRFAANHPAGTQKAIGAGISTVAGGIGAGIGGVPGAVVGASIRGVTPAQAAIREGAGRLAGEAPAVARTAGRAVAAANYGKEIGLNVKPTGFISTGNMARAFDNYTDSMGLKAPRVLDQFGKVVFGPEAPPTPKVPSRVGGALRTGAGTVGKALQAISGPVAMTDLAQTLEPNRRDIGIMGIGPHQPTPQGAALQQLNQQNTAAMDARTAERAAQLAQLRAAILARFGF